MVKIDWAEPRVATPKITSEDEEDENASPKVKVVIRNRDDSERPPRRKGRSALQRELEDDLEPRSKRETPLEVADEREGSIKKVDFDPNAATNGKPLGYESERS